MLVKRCISFIVLGIFFAAYIFALEGTPVCPFKEKHKDYGAPETRELLPNWHLIDKATLLYHKCQEETLERINELNSYLKAKGKKLWKYNPKPNNPPYVCLSYAASTAADWWALQLGKKLPTYKDFYNDKLEVGFNPRKLEVAYLHHSKRNPWTYAQIPSFIEKCPVKGVSIPIRPLGYAHILTEKKTYTLEDPVVPGLTYQFTPDTYPMDYKFKRVFKQSFGKIKPEVVIEALEKWGIGITQFEIRKQKFLMGTHTIAVVGWGEVDGKIVFLCHDSFGDYDVDHIQDEKGAPRYRYITADMMDELIVFPHKLIITPKKIDEQTYEIEVKDSTGNLRDAKMRAFFPKLNLEIPVVQIKKGTYQITIKPEMKGQKLKIVAAKKYFYSPDGNPHYIEIKVK